jgi:hypothetical protein
VRKLALLAVAGVALVAVGLAAAARSPRVEHLALVKGDVKLATAALLRESDLARVPPGWRPLSSSPDNSTPICPWQDYSALTLTGRGESGFEPKVVGGAGFVGSTVDIYSSVEGARGRFVIDTHPGTASCEAEALRKAFGAGLVTTEALQLTAPKAGERAVAYRFGFEQAGRAPKRIYVNLIEFVRGRAVAVIETTNFDTAGSGSTRLVLARLVDARLS